MGGVSDGFALEGFDVTGIDIVDAPKMVDYKHKFIQADMLSLKGTDFKGFDVVWGSPPCRDFSRMCSTSRKFWRGRWVEWKDSPNPDRGLNLVNAFLKFKEDANPKIWIMENVPRLANYVSKPTQINYIGKTMKRAFWGNFPHFLMPMQTTEPNKSAIRDPWLRAKIPLACSRAFAKACKEQLVEVDV
jgi:site-specific DNA-cytosine methylase